MYHFVHLDVQSRGNELLGIYRPMVPEKLHCCLQGRDPEGLLNSDVIAFGATFEGKPIGIALASLQKDDKHVTVHHLFVAEEYRNKHVGRQLLGKLKDAAIKAGGKFFFLIYPLGDPATPALEKVIASTNWKGTRPFMIRCKYRVATFDMPWVHIDYHYPPGFEEFPWSEITEEEKKDLRKQLAQHIFPAALSPFFEENLIEPINSLGLRYEGQVVGWMLTHRIAPDTVRYSNLYVRRDLRYREIPMKLLFDSIRLHLKNQTPWAILEIPLLYVSPAWKRFAERRLVPYADEVTRLVQAWDVV